MTGLLKDIFGGIITVLKSKYKLIFILFALWIYRIDFIPEDGSGIGKAIQIVSLFGLLAILYRKSPNLFSFSYQQTPIQIRSLLWLYSFAVISTLWAFIPSFAFFLAFQNLVMIMLWIWIMSLCRTFKQMEKLFIIVCICVAVFESIGARAVSFCFSPFIHFLPGASTGALTFSYCVGEYLSNKCKDRNRRGFLMASMIISLIVMITSTSSGANASAVGALGIALLFSGNLFLSFVFIGISLTLYLNPNLVESLMMWLMPGKTMESINTASGRTVLWELIKIKTAERPLIGWGFACIERAIGTEFLGETTSDAHSNFVGMYGSLGIIGLLLFVFHLGVHTLNAFKNRVKLGYLGILCATICAIVNSYSYGFLSGKTCSITIVYFGLVVLSYYYSNIKYYE